MTSRTYTGRQARIPFHGSPRPSLGVEIELQILNPETWNLTSGSCQILDRVGESARIKPELTQSTIEVNTAIRHTAAEIRADLTESMAYLYEIADELDLAYASIGTHPFAQWKDQHIFPNERYVQLVERIQWPARRLMIYGLHVHVGVQSGEKAIAIGTALMTYLPHLLAISASSPFVDVKDTGLASARAKIFEGMPTAGLPYRLANYGEFQAFMNTLINAGAIESVREIWWDIRPHPNFGTVEVRICDAPPTLKEITYLTALIQCLVVWLDGLYDDGVFVDTLSPWVIRENKWRSVRYGVDAELILDSHGTRAPMRDEIARLVALLEPVSEQLGCSAELQGVLRVLRHGPPYERLRRKFSETGDFRAIVQCMSQTLREDVFSA